MNTAPVATRLLLLTIATLIIALAHAALGARPIGAGALAQALLAFDPAQFEHQILWHFRLPRLLAAMVAGAGLALCGALLQSIVRNPLAEPQLLGLNAGAALAVVLATTLLSDGLGAARPMVAALGALGAFATVLALASAGRAGPTPLKLILCGVAVSGLCGAVTAAVLLLDESTLLELRHWLAGDLAGQGFAQLWPVLPAFAPAMAAAFLLAPSLASLSLGDAVATGLGLHPNRLRLGALLAAALLCGSAVTLAGPIGFLGLLVPQVVRRLIGGGLRAQLLGCLLGGPALLLAADLLARTVLLPRELATGIVTGLLGAPFFILIVARGLR